MKKSPSKNYYKITQITGNHFGPFRSTFCSPRKQLTRIRVKPNRLNIQCKERGSSRAKKQPESYMLGTAINPFVAALILRCIRSLPQ